MAKIFTITDEDRKHYGGTSIGNFLVLARNLFRADAGTRFILASHGGWDHHSDIYKDKTRSRPIYMEDIACTIYSALGID